MIISIKITGLYPDTRMEEIIQFLKQAEDDLQVLSVDISGLELGKNSSTDYMVNDFPKGFCLATVQGAQAAVSKLSGHMLRGVPVEITILSITSHLPEYEHDPNSFPHSKEPNSMKQAFGRLKENDRLHADAEKIKAFFNKTNQASCKFFKDMSHKMKPAMEKVGDAFKNIGKRK